MGSEIAEAIKTWRIGADEKVQACHKKVRAKVKVRSQNHFISPRMAHASSYQPTSRNKSLEGARWNSKSVGH
jgi:hypothetical protein